MNEQKKQKLLEQYDDAAFALLMDEYAEEEGARLMAEFEAAQAAGQVPEMPRELDEQCRRMIRRNSAQKRGRQAARRFRKVAVKAAVAVLVFIGLMTTVVMSVEALRVPVLNSILSMYEDYMSINIGDKVVVEAKQDPLLELLPDDYAQHYFSVDDDNLACSFYQNSNGDTVQFTMSFAIGEKRYDYTDGNKTELTIGEHEAILIQNDGYWLIWFDAYNEIIYSFCASNLEKSNVIDICNELSTFYDFQLN